MPGRGPALPRAPGQRAGPAPLSARAIEFTTFTAEYDGGRRVTAYVPPAAPTAVVYCGDGQLVPRWAEALDDAEREATMIVGAHRDGDEERRLREYSPVFEPERFAAHEQFFVVDLREWVHAELGVRLPAERTAVFGVSAGGELALALGVAHPDLYGAVLCASPGGGYQPPEPAHLQPPLPRTYLVAGTGEPFFAANARRWADALDAAGGDVIMRERRGRHGGSFWEREFPRMVRWAFGSSGERGL